jgi:hypothetical protein
MAKKEMCFRIKHKKQEYRVYAENKKKAKKIVKKLIE